MRMRVLLPVLAALAAPAHDYPVTYGVLTLGGGKATFRLRLVLHHLQPELETFAGKRLALRDADVFEPGLLEAFLRDRVVLLDGQGHAHAWKVAGQALDAFDLVLTLEAPQPWARGARLRHTLFFDRHAQQQNLVTVEGLGRRHGLTFDARHPELALEAVPSPQGGRR